MGLTRKQAVMVAVMLGGTFLAVLNQTLLSPAIPSIMADFGISAPTAQWLMSGYSLVEAIIIPLSAYLIGRFSTRKLFITSFALFAAGSALAAWGPDFVVVMAGRILQAAGTGVVMPMVFTVIILLFPREKRGVAMGLIGLLIGFAPAIGPAVSGLLVDSVGWHVLFMIVTVLAVVVLVLGVFALENYGDFERTTLDVPSVLMSSVGLVCLLYGLSSFSSAGNLAVPAALIVAGAAVLALFVRRQTKLDNPMLQVGVLGTVRYRIAVICIVTLQAVLIGLSSALPLFIQNVCGYSATVSGFIVLPGALLGAVMSMFAGRIFDKRGVRGVVVGGSLVMLAGAVCLFLLPAAAGVLFIAGANAVLILGLQASMTPLNTWGINSLDNRVIQHANALSNTLNQVAASFGTALLISVSAMGSVVAPQAGAAEQLYAGYHLSFAVVMVLAVCLLLVVLAFVRDKRSAPAKAAPQAVAAQDDDAILVKAAMNRDASWISQTASVREALLEIAKADTSGLPVVDARQRVVGFISDGDIMNYLGKDDRSVDTALFMYRFVDDEKLQSRLASLLDKNVMELATKRVVTVESSMDLGEACRVLAERRIKKVPVVDGGRLVGALSRRNIVRNVVEGLS
ncbi:MDR family MFS transporter [Enteroscipio rubneri]|uniref:Multidrug transporter n=1 Tax=Enteroscipio rubneri TaxID=2070686 RepID=A0A2K2UEV0_9ACTN|nr:MDR family MFS transporter [Enteroscipio rubneri]PNV68772.1 multidrug transporter [Enteroscipio rubneri]